MTSLLRAVVALLLFLVPLFSFAQSRHRVTLASYLAEPYNNCYAYGAMTALILAWGVRDEVASAVILEPCCGVRRRAVRR